MKVCKRCKCSKPLDGFYFHPKSGDRLQEKCKECAKAYQKHRRRTNPAVQEYDCARAKLPHRRANARKHADAWRVDHPEAYRALTALGNAIRDGRIKRCPCESCGTTVNVQGHHPDYRRPLAVEWLCARCNARRRVDGSRGRESASIPGVAG